MVLLLVVIYISFISLGLPDSILGSAWPSMYGGLGVSIGSAGIISMIVSIGTVVSSLLSDRAIKRFGTGIVTASSVLMTAFALLGFSFSNSLAALCLFAVPLGIGAGSVDAALNNFVALHYKAKHMSWLHCFWGVGASLGPIIMALSLTRLHSWNSGYRIISILQFALVAALILSLPLWRKAKPPSNSETEQKQTVMPKLKLIKLPGAKHVLLAFFCYCGIELTVGLWGSTYLVTIRGVGEATAASWVSLYFIGITFGRFLSGFLAIKLKHKQMIQYGQALVACGIVVLILPFHEYFALSGLFIMGLGLAPIYPSIIHETPINFGSEYSQSMIGLQMACAYVGTTCMPPLFGLIGAKTSYGLFPAFLGALLILMVIMISKLYKAVKKQA